MRAASHHPSQPRISTVPSLQTKAALRTVIGTMSLWAHRYHSRRIMLSLTDTQCADIGRSRAEVLAEAQRPFWRG